MSCSSFQNNRVPCECSYIQSMVFSENRFIGGRLCWFFCLVMSTHNASGEAWASVTVQQSGMEFGSALSLKPFFRRNLCPRDIPRNVFFSVAICFLMHIRYLHQYAIRVYWHALPVLVFRHGFYCFYVSLPPPPPAIFRNLFQCLNYLFLYLSRLMGCSSTTLC